MSAYAITEIANLASRTASGESGLASTSSDAVADPHSSGEPSLRVFLNVTAAAGTSPTLDVDIVATVNGEDYVIDSFAQATGVTKEARVISDCPRVVKAVWTIGGVGPSFTFEVQATRW